MILRMVMLAAMMVLSSHSSVSWSFIDCGTLETICLTDYSLHRSSLSIHGNFTKRTWLVIDAL